MPTQAEIIVAGRQLLDHPEIGALLRRGCATEHAASQKARVIAKKLLTAAEQVAKVMAVRV